MVFDETRNYDFILPSKICQRHVETKAANTWELVQSDQSPFQKTLPALRDFITVNAETFIIH